MSQDRETQIAGQRVNDWLAWILDSQNVEELRQKYNAWANSYDADLKPAWWFTLVNVARMVEQVLPQKNARILDAAAGTGLMGEALVERGYTNLTAFDLSEEMLAVAKQKQIYQRLHLCNLEDTRTFDEQGPFEAVLATGIFTKGHAGVDILQNLVCLLEQGGLLVITVRDNYYEQIRHGLESLPIVLVNEERFDIYDEKLIDIMVFKKLTDTEFCTQNMPIDSFTTRESTSDWENWSEEAFMFGVSSFDELELQTEDNALATLHTQVADALNVPLASVSLDEPLNTIVDDSLMVARLYHAIVPKSADLSLVQFWQRSISSLADSITGVSEQQPTTEDAAYDFDETVPADLRQAGWHPLTPSQQFFYDLYVHAVAENPSILQLHQVLRIVTFVDVAAMGRACQAFVNRHDGARATFHVREGRCYQRVCENVSVDFRHIHASTEQAVCAAIEQENNSVWNIEKDFPVKFRLYQLDAHNFIFHLSFLHIVADGYVMMMMMDELAQLYSAAIKGEAARLPPVGKQLIDYSRHQVARLHSAEGERLRRYWRQGMVAPLADVRIKADYSGVTHYLHSDMIAVRLDDTLHEAIDQFISQTRITLNAFLLAVVQLILFKLTGQSEARLISRLNNRLDETVVCTMANIATAAVFRTQLSATATLNDVCLQAFETVMEAVAHQGYPILTLAEDLGVTLAEGALPLAPVAYHLERIDVSEKEIARLFDPDHRELVKWGDLLIKNLGCVDLWTWQAAHIGFYFIETNNTVVCFLSYNPYLYKRTTMLAIGDAIKTVSRTIVRDATQLVSDL